MPVAVARSDRHTAFAPLNEGTDGAVRYGSYDDKTLARLRWMSTDMVAVLDEAVQGLPEHHRLVFTLREMEGKTYEEIAEITDCNLGTVKSRLNRARNSFAQIIGPLLG